MAIVCIQKIYKFKSLFLGCLLLVIAFLASGNLTPNFLFNGSQPVFAKDGDSNGSGGDSHDSGGSSGGSSGSGSSSSSSSSGSEGSGSSSGNDSAKTNSQGRVVENPKPESKQTVSSQESKIKTTVVDRVKPTSAEASQNKAASFIKQPAEDEEAELERVIEKTETAEIEFRVNNNHLEVESLATSSAQGVKLGQLGKLTVKVVRRNSQAMPVSVTANAGNLEISSAGIKAISSFPVILDKNKSEIKLKTKEGLKEVKLLPDQAAQVAREVGLRTSSNTMSLELGDQPETSGMIIFRVNGIKSGKLFGLIPLAVEATVDVDASNGQVAKVIQPQWLTILSPLISQ